jgi:signal transduction histidine kinase
MADEWLERFLREAIAVDPPGPRHRLWLGRVYLPAAAELVLAVILFYSGNALLQAANGREGYPHAEIKLILISLLGTAPLLLRGRWPLQAWALSALAMVLSLDVVRPHALIGTPHVPTLGIVYLLCLYAIAVRCRRAVTLGVLAFSAVGCYLIDPPTAALALLCAVPVLLGYTVRVRRAARRTLAEQEARHEEETAVLAERQRIARELHDVVAHHMSVIAIQAEAAPYKVADPPPELAEGFADIRASALDGLTELRRVLGVLRTEDTAQTAPQPGLERLDEVIASARGGGLSVETSISGEAVPLPAGVGLSAYRILQEALSNVMRHAPGASVHVEVGYDPEILRIRVANAPAAQPAPVPAATGGGHGLTGMRERAAMLGGELAAEPTPDGGFAVSATLPLKRTP